jgi:transposase-like protein
MSTPVTIRTAARVLGVSASQIRRWVQQGAPAACERRPRTVNVEDLRAWRQGPDSLTALAAALLDTLRRDCGEGMTAPRLLGIDDARAAALLLVAFDRAHHALTGRDAAAPWSAEVAALRAIAGG